MIKYVKVYFFFTRVESEHYLAISRRQKFIATKAAFLKAACIDSNDDSLVSVMPCDSSTSYLI